MLINIYDVSKGNLRVLNANPINTCSKWHSLWLSLNRMDTVQIDGNLYSLNSKHINIDDDELDLYLVLTHVHEESDSEGEEDEGESEKKTP